MALWVLPGAVVVLLPQHAHQLPRQSPSYGSIYSLLDLPGGHLGHCDELPDEGLSPMRGLAASCAGAGSIYVAAWTCHSGSV